MLDFVFLKFPSLDYGLWQGKEPRSIFALILIPLPLEHLVGKERPDLPAGVNIVDRVFELTLYDLHSWRSAGCVAEF